MSSSFIISIVFAIGSSAFAWSRLVRSTGNADPKKVLASALVVGIIVFLFAYTLLSVVLGIN